MFDNTYQNEKADTKAPLSTLVIKVNAMERGSSLPMEKSHFLSMDENPSKTLRSITSESYGYVPLSVSGGNGNSQLPQNLNFTTSTFSRSFQVTQSGHHLPIFRDTFQPQSQKTMKKSYSNPDTIMVSGSHQDGTSEKSSFASASIKESFSTSSKL